MLTRTAEKPLRRLAGQYPVVTVTGPRQSGKTTLVKKVFPKYTYINLEVPDQRAQAQNDPRGLLEDATGGIILDEVQRVPELVSYIQGIVDEDGRPGRFILTGSQQFELSGSISQSLAGRTAIIRLLPFSYNEVYGKKRPSLEDIIYTGFYPRIHDRQLNPTETLAFYLETYVQRDVRQLLNIRDLQAFEVFLRLCAAHTGQLVNFAKISNGCGVDLKTVKAWISVLQASYIIFLLQPHFRNMKKRVIKTPKLYFYDVGLASYLLDISQPSHVSSHPLQGALFENYIIAELMKKRFNAVKQANFYFYRDHTGNEVDVIVDGVTQVTGLEIKQGKTVHPGFFMGLTKYAAVNPSLASCYMVYGGSRETMWQNIKVVPHYRATEIPEV